MSLEQATDIRNKKQNEDITYGWQKVIFYKKILLVEKTRLPYKKLRWNVQGVNKLINDENVLESSEIFILF